MFDLTQIPPLENARHQLFASYILSGMGKGEAYKKAGYKAKNIQSACASANALLKNPKVAEYLRAVQEQAAEGDVLSVQEKRQYLARCVRVPIGTIDIENKQDENLDLVVKQKKTTVGDEDGAALVTWEIHKPDPLRAIEIDNKMAAHDPESEMHQLMSNVLKNFNSDPLPHGSM